MDAGYSGNTGESQSIWANWERTIGFSVLYQEQNFYNCCIYKQKLEDLPTEREKLEGPCRPTTLVIL